MSFNIAGSSTSDLSLSTVKELNTPEKLNRFLKGRLENIDTHINTLTAQEVDGVAFLEITQEYLTKNLEIPLGPAKKILKLINEIKEGIGSLISGIAGLKLQDDESSSSDEKEEDAKQIEPNRIEEAFQVKYQGTTLETFCSRLKLFHDEWYQQIKPYAPYLTIIQSSGSDVNTMDVLAPLAENVGKEYDYTRVVYLGIPLWGSLAQAGVSLINLVHLASQKIRNFSKKNNDYLANLACMACSLSLEVSPRIAEVDSLIASHMATALGVSLDRTSILCTYPSDPILASGALKGIIDVGWENCLDTLLELFSRGVVEEGERGELVNRILFSKAYADAVRECFPDSPVTYLQKVPLKLFLKSLLREEIDGLDELLNRMGIDEAEIGFNHWTSLLATNQKYVESGGMKFLTENLVIEAYHRHTAFKMPLGFPVIDHIIPFKYNAGYGIISIQNKNSKKTTFGAKDISSLIHPSYSFGKWKKGYKILGIYIDLGLDREKAVESKAELKSRNVPQTRSKNKNNEDKEDVKNDYDQIIYIQGVGSFKCCSKEISERLSKILFTRPWPLDTQWSEFDEKTDLKREDVIKTFLPLVFEQKQSLVDKWQLI
ncbi:hypothetical protein RhiirA1_446816 [Rhizophagus irregularis]|uniref:SAM domain-containing protein n=1 Tax=Rhizophagus irregularis TaxID=588596 RepID=A0A2N0QWM7_9GLOM|nr:hypothetical protein RhiirA1_446816 [Rhizophagus irregularis]